MCQAAWIQIRPDIFMSSLIWIQTVCKSADNTSKQRVKDNISLDVGMISLSADDTRRQSIKVGMVFRKVS